MKKDEDINLDTIEDGNQGIENLNPLISDKDLQSLIKTQNPAGIFTEISKAKGVPIAYLKKQLLLLYYSAVRKVGTEDEKIAHIKVSADIIINLLKAEGGFNQDLNINFHNYSDMSLDEIQEKAQDKIQNLPPHIRNAVMTAKNKDLIQENEGKKDD